MTRRRTLLRAAVGAGVAAASGSSVTACGRDHGAVEILVQWNGAELAGFRTVVDGIRTHNGVRVRIVPVGEQFAELLQARLNTANPPDIAIGPTPGLIRRYADLGRRVVPLAPALGERTPEGLRRVVTMPDGRIVGLWVKAAHKSLFWHRPDTPGLEAPPQTWDDLVGLVQRLVRRGRSPLAIGAADGWVLTDWFENALVGVGGGAVYDDVAIGRPGWDSPLVTDALSALGRLWSVPGALVDGARRALLTEFEESIVDVFATRRADLVFVGDFAASVIARIDEARPPPTTTFRFPTLAPAPGGGQPLILGGDVAAVFTTAGAASGLLTELSRPESMRPWIRRGGYLLPSSTVDDAYGSGPAGRFAGEIAREQVRFDLSDQLVGRLGGRQGRGMWQIMQDFFRAVTSGRPGAATVRDAVRGAQHRLVEAGRRG